MSSAISSQITSIGNLLRSSGRLIVPPYQRNYSWDEEHYADLWLDIQETFDGSTEEYVLGTVVIDTSSYPNLTIIDGQQRVTTVTILICALKWHLLATNETELASLISQDFLTRPDYEYHSLRPNLELNLNDQDFFERYIISAYDPKLLKSLATEDLCSPSNLQLAKCYIYMAKQIGQMVKEGLTLEVIAQRIISSLQERILIIRIDVEDDLKAFTLFESLNNRGLDLSEADLLKNFIFSKAGENLNMIKANWDIMSLNIGHSSLMTFLRHHWNSHYGPIPKPGLFAAIKKIIHNSDDALHFSDQINVSSEFYGAILDPNHDHWQRLNIENINEVKKLLNHLTIMRAEQCNILLLSVLEHAPEYFKDFIIMVRNFTFRFSTIGGRNTADVLRAYLKAAHAIRENAFNQNPPSTAEHTFYLFFKELYPHDNQFQSAFAKKTIKTTILARYILSEINNSISAPEATQYSADGVETDLEHIMPKKFKDHWAENPSEFPGGHTKYLNRIGNMTLISPELNRRLGNADFDTKKQVYAQDCLEITKRILDEDNWTANEINRRQNWLASEAVKLWRYPLNS